MAKPKKLAGKDHDPVDDRPFIEANADAKKRYGRFNLAVIGNTGVGKSSLVNAVFGREHAKVGKGLPVTKGVNYYHDDFLGVWDFEGFEIGSTDAPSESLRVNLQTIAERPADEQIAVVWYCVLHNADRLTEPDVAMIRALDAAGLPVILVLTKTDWTKNRVTGTYRAPADTELFREWLEHPVDGDGEPVHLPLRHVCVTSASGRNGKETGHGLGDLVDATIAVAPESARNAFRIAQKLNLEWKRQMAHRVVVGASVSSGAAAAIPIPVADATTLAPIQMAMMGRIAHIYGLELKDMISAATLAQLAAHIAGKALARSFVKFIPVVGSAVNGTVASALTAATGEGWMRLCERVHTGDLDASSIAETLDQFSPTVRSVVKNIFLQKASRT
ncbi:DUF697 domain-containing protein [Nesterenkonia sp. CF4.4]|uniref:DUF697 domain-containing protein n=1 Tax=Nesterenkonia sp. CF4.4 TaxID=3373079 RepID=UPI003EE7134A